MIQAHRRTLLRAGAVLAVAVSGAGFLRTSKARAQAAGETAPKGSFDIVAKDFEEFADKMGV